MNRAILGRSLRFLALSVGLVLAGSALAAPAPTGSVTYNPTAKIVQGNQPLSTSYNLTITSPSNLAAGTNVVVTLVPSVLSAPSGIANSVALSFLSFAPATLTFTGPNQILTTTVSVNVPLGQYAGDYTYQINTSGWPSTLVIADNGATINALVSPAGSVDGTAPAIVLQTPVEGTPYTYYPASGAPVTVPISFTASVGTGGQPITGMNALLNGNPITLATTGTNTLNATATANLSLTTAGTYTVSVTATNVSGTSEVSADFTVVVSYPPPTITVASPSAGSTFSFPTGGTGATVPISYTTTSFYGNITATDVTLDGASLTPLGLNLNGVGTAQTATGSMTLTGVAAGSHLLTFTAANAYGAATPFSVTFYVQSVVPVPTVSISSPATGSVFNRTVGDPATVVNYAFSGGTNYGTVQSVTVLLDGTAVTPTLVGLNSAALTGSGTVSFSSAGTHTLTVTVSNGYSTATTSTSFTVVQTQPQVCENVTWLPPISLNKTIQGGSTMPIKFQLSCKCGGPISDQTNLISIYEVYANGTMSTPVIYPYGSGSPNPPDYAINGGHYQLNFTTANGTHHYVIQIYHPLSADGSSLQLLGTKDLFTQGSSGCNNGQNGNGNNGQDDDNGLNCNNGQNGDDNNGQNGNGNGSNGRNCNPGGNGDNH